MMFARQARNARNALKLRIQGFRQRSKHKHPILPTLGAFLLCLAVYNLLIRNNENNPIQEDQITYLSPQSTPLKKTAFPVVYMPAPKIDHRTVYYGHKEVDEFEEILRVLSEEHPSWKTKNWCSLRRQWFLHAFQLSNLVLKAIHTFLEYSYHTPSLLNLMEIQHQLSILNQRQFPTAPRQMDCDSCFPYNFHTLIKPTDLCQHNLKILAVIIVTTIPRNVQERLIVRRSWGADALKRNLKLVFLFGAGWPPDQVKILEKEHKLYNDILMDDFHDNYYNLTQKVLMGFRWALKECPQAEFIIRSADDTTINIPEIYLLLHKFGKDETFQKYQVGHCFEAFSPHRSLDHRGYLTTFEYDKDVFPPYALGSVFITSSNLTKELLEISPNVPFIAIEDAYFGLALAKLGRGCHHITGMIGHYTTHNTETRMAQEHFYQDIFID